MLRDRIDDIMTRDLNDAAKRREAASEIEVAIAMAAESAAAPDQLADLADAIDAFEDRSYGIAASLARAAVSRRRGVEPSRRPPSMSRPLSELRALFERLRKAGADRAPATGDDEPACAAARPALGNGLP